MQVEMIGCTSAGKSTLAAAAIEAGARLSLKVVMSDEMILRTLRLNRLRGHLARTLLVDLVAVYFGLLTLRRHWRYYRFALRICRASSGSALARLNLARNALRKIGIFEFIRRHDTENDLVLVDEGTLHAAHNLFVDVSGEDRSSQLDEFLQLAPLPDVVVYLHQAEPVLVQRTLQRGHKRVPDGTRTSVVNFVQRAVSIFERLREDRRVADLLVVVDDPTQQVLVPESPANPRVAQAQRLFQESVSRQLSATRSQIASAPAAVAGVTCPS